MLILDIVAIIPAGAQMRFSARFRMPWYNGGMAITKNGQEKQIEGTLGQTVDIYNGDWEALKEITKKWNFLDETSALRFALAVLTEAEDGTLQIGDSTISPTKGLLKNDGE